MLCLGLSCSSSLFAVSLPLIRSLPPLSSAHSRTAQCHFASVYETSTKYAVNNPLLQLPLLNYFINLMKETDYVFLPPQNQRSMLCSRCLYIYKLARDRAQNQNMKYLNQDMGTRDHWPRFYGLKSWLIWLFIVKSLLRTKLPYETCDFLWKNKSIWMMVID